MIIKNIKKEVKLSPNGKPYASIIVQFDEYQENGKLVWISGFGNKRNWAWKVGDDVQPVVTQNGKYYNFTFDDTEENRIDVYRLPATVGFVLSVLKSAKRDETPDVKTGGYVPPEAPSDDIPF